MKPARHLAAIAAWIAFIPLAQGVRAQDPFAEGGNEEAPPPAEEKQAADLLKEGDYIEAPEGPVRSPLGYEAITTPFSRDEEDSEGSLTTIILKGDQFVARIKNARPVMFSPKGDILLLMDAAPDDDCRHFLLNVAGGEKAPEFDARHRIGKRHADSPRWSKDGKFIQFVNYSGDPFGNSDAETVVVAEHLGKNRQPEKNVKGVEQKVLREQHDSSMKEMAAAEAALAQATTPEQQAAARLQLEKQRQWLKELENRISQSDPSSKVDAWLVSTASAESLVNEGAPDKAAAERALALTDKALADANGDASGKTIALMIRSRCLFILDRKQEAIEAVQQAIKADPRNGDDVTAHLHGILADYQAGKLPEIDPATSLRKVPVPEE